jgi:hypothetical protein
MKMEIDKDITNSQDRVSGHISKDFKSLFKNKSKIFKKMAEIETKYSNNVISNHFDQDFFDFEKFVNQSDQGSIKCLKDQDSNNSSKFSEKNHSKDYRKRKTMYIVFLEKKIIQLLDHIYFMSKGQAEIAKSYYNVVITLQSQFEAEKLRLFNYCEMIQKNFNVTPQEEYVEGLTNFFTKQNENRKKIVQGSLETVVNYSVPKLLYFLSNSQDYLRKDELVLFDTSNQIEGWGFKKEVNLQKQNYDKILFDVVLINERIGDQLNAFDDLMRRIFKQAKLKSSQVLKKIAEIERIDSNLVDCSFVDGYTKNILQYFKP